MYKLSSLLGIVVLCCFLKIALSFGSPYLKVYTPQGNLFYSLEHKDSVTFENLDLKGYYFVIHRAAGSDTLAPNAVDSFKVVDIERLAAITVSTGSYSRTDVPVSAEISNSLFSRDDFELVEIVGNQRVAVPSQKDTLSNLNGTKRKLWWILSGTTPAGSTRSYELVKTISKTPFASPFNVEEENGGLNFRWGNQKILKYQLDSIKPAGQIDNYYRQGYISELFSPLTQNLLVQDGPAGYEHHRALFFMWKHFLFEGETLDIWWSVTNAGNIKIETIENKVAGPVFAGIKAKHFIVVNKNQKRMLNEDYDLKIWNVGGPDKKYWLFDVGITQTPGTSSPVTVKQYEYGGMCVKSAGEWYNSNADYLTDVGTNAEGGLKLKAKWNSISGIINNDSNTLNLFSNPENPGHPEGAQNYPTINYIGFTAVQDEPFDMISGNSYTFKYRIYVNEGSVNPSLNTEKWRDFGEPPIVNVSEL